MSAHDWDSAILPLPRLQRVLTRMTAEIFRYCESRGITVTLMAGSVLGAVRHEGIIPWDDDVDLGMPRADYDRFLAVFQQEPIPNMSLQCWMTEPKFPSGFAKIRLDATAIVDRDGLSSSVHNGIFVDIFPIDDVPANPVLEFVQRYGVGLLNLFIERGEFDNSSGVFSRRRMMARWLAQRVRAIVPNGSWLYRARDFCLRMSGARASGLVDCLSMFGTNARHRTRVERDTLFPPVKARLGDANVLIPADSDRYLTKMYRDWRQLPPPEQRRPFHLISVDFRDHPFSRE